MATPPIRFGIQTGQQTVEWAQLLALWQKADAWGYDSLWNFDHFYPIFVDPEGPCLESWTTLAALAHRHHGERQHLPPSVRHRQDGGHPGPRERRPLQPGPRRGLVRARAPR